MFINAPKQFTRKDIKNCGVIYKDYGYRYLLSDIKNKDLNNTFELVTEGFYSYVYNICETYLFIIGNQKGTKDIKPNKIDFLSKILDFEYKIANKNKKIKTLSIPNSILTLITKEKWLQDDFLNEKGVLIDNIINNKKIHLQAFKRPYERYLRYLVEIGKIGTFKNGVVVDMLTEKEIKILKDTSISGYIIKYDNKLFNC